MMNLIYIWSHNNKSKIYLEMYNRYLEKGVQFPKVTKDNEPQNEDELQLIYCVNEIKILTCIIADALDSGNLYNLLRGKLFNKLVDKANELLTDYDKYYTKFSACKGVTIDKHYEESKESLILVKNLLSDSMKGVKPNSDLYRTFTSSAQLSREKKEEKAEKEQEIHVQQMSKKEGCNAILDDQSSDDDEEDHSFALFRSVSTTHVSSKKPLTSGSQAPDHKKKLASSQMEATEKK